MEINVSQVSFHYRGKTVIQDLNLQVKKGEHIGIIGESGCGKSTLLQMIAGLCEPDRGSIVVEGETKAEQRRKKVAVVLQNPMLFPGTIRENITCGHEMSKEWIHEVCEAAQIQEWIEELPQGLDYDLGERGNCLSGGQAQRIAIARAFAKNAPIILLDEATSALDRKTKEAVLQAISCLTKGKTVLHVTHQPELLCGCSHLYHMTEGRLYEE